MKREKSKELKTKKKIVLMCMCVLLFLFFLTRGHKETPEIEAPTIEVELEEILTLSGYTNIETWKLANTGYCLAAEEHFYGYVIPNELTIEQGVNDLLEAGNYFGNSAGLSLKQEAWGYVLTDFPKEIQDKLKVKLQLYAEKVWAQREKERVRRK